MKRRWGQAFISCLLALALFIPSFASTINAAPLSEGQIVDAGGTLYYDKNGKAVTAQSLGENSSIVSVSKTLQGTDVENEFIINLDVKTTTKIQDVKFNTDAAVVLVLDISGSMAGSYIADLKKAAISFLESFAKVEGNAKRYVSLVTFATDARIEYGWLDATNSTNLDNLKTKINSLNATGGTFMQGGLLMARNLLRTDALPLGTDNEVIENRSVILFTDGQPTYSSSLPVSPNGYANTRDRAEYIAGASITYDSGNGSSTSANDQSRAKTMADIVKKSASFNIGSTSYNKYSATLYTIGFGGGSPNAWLASDISTNSSCAYAASNAANLNAVFDAIYQQIESWAKAWVVTDPMGENIEFTQIISQNDIDTGLLKFSNNTLEWNLKDASPVSFVNNVYTYQYSYKIKLDNTKSTFTVDSPYKTNGQTVLHYVIVEDSKVVSDVLAADFTIPSVKGYLGKFDFAKVDVSGKNLVGCEFKLENLTAGKPGYTVASAADGKVEFSKIPSGYEYRLTEISLPNNLKDVYVLSDETLTVKVSMGKVTLWDSNNNQIVSSNYEFVNRKNNVDFSFKKIDGNKYADSKYTTITGLSGAEFAVYKLNAEGQAQGKAQDLIPADVINGTTISAYWEAYSINGASNQVTSDKNGDVTMSLDDGCYMLVETKAPSTLLTQYVLPTGQWAIKVEVDNANPIEITEVKDANGQSPPAFTTGYAYLPNIVQHDLPLTGGLGIAAFVGVGALILIVASAILVINNRRSRLSKFQVKN